MSLKGKSNVKRPKKVGTRTYAKQKFNHNALLQLNLSELYDRHMAYKRTGGFSRITMRDYDAHYGYFLDFLREKEGVKDLLLVEIIPNVFTIMLHGCKSAA